MPQTVNRIIHYRDYGKNYHRLEFNSDFPRNVKYVAGDPGSLIPEGMVLNTSLQQSFDEPLFNRSNNGIIIESLNGPAIIYLELRKDITIKELYGPTTNINYDLYYGQEGLVYVVSSDVIGTISIRIKIQKDINSIYQKLTTSPEDMSYRQSFINRALAAANKTFSEADSEHYPELMKAEQAAAFLQIEKKTLQNLVSLGKIPFTKIGKKRYFKKSELLGEKKPTKGRK